MIGSVRARRSRGISLIEALVALAIMAIGMLGIIGVQSTLRSTSDIAKQRSEAVRIAQLDIEAARSFVALAGGTAATEYNDLPVGTFSEPAVAGINASYTLTRTVTLLPEPRKGKSVAVTVTWQDRSGVDQRVSLSTLIAAISPELPLTVAVPGAGDVIQQVKGRRGGIPMGAKDLGGGRSGWIPPGSTSGVVWIFNNSSGLLTQCLTTATVTADLIYDLANPGSNNVTCSTTDLFVYVGGFVRYGLDFAQPTAAQASSPPSQPIDPPVGDLLTVEARYVVGGVESPQPCYVVHVNSASSAVSRYSQFACAVPATIQAGTPPYWSGYLWFGPPGLISTMLADTAASRVKACRYHTAAGYSVQTVPLSNQNFFVMRAGDGATTSPVAYTCPTPLLAHQPNT